MCADICCSQAIMGLKYYLHCRNSKNKKAFLMNKINRRLKDCSKICSPGTRSRVSTCRHNLCGSRRRISNFFYLFFSCLHTPRCASRRRTIRRRQNEQHTCNATVAKTHHLVRGSARINSLISGYFLRISILREACGSSCIHNRSLHQDVKLG